MPLLNVTFELDKGPFQLPQNHKPGMQVPKGGSSCASCAYLGNDGASCVNTYFQRWHGTDQLPAPADEYCSDWYEPRLFWPSMRSPMPSI